MATGHGDHAPVAQSGRTFSFTDFASLWIGLVVCVPVYYLAGSLVELGMTWRQGIATVVLGNAIVLVPLILTASAGTRYGIPFPVLARAAFGVNGAHVPTLLRALIACGWFGIQTWVGGQAVFLLVPSAWSASWIGRTLPWLGTSPLHFACFMLFWAAQMAVVWRGTESIRVMNNYSSPILVVLTLALFAWAVVAAGGLGRMLSPAAALPPAEFWALFFPSLTANVGSWSCVALNIPDFGRYAKSQADQIAGQAGLPLFMGTFAFAGLAVTSASAVVFGRPISDPLLLVGEIARASGAAAGSTVALVSAVGIGLATLTTNVPANVVASANVLVDLNPNLFSFGRAALATGAIGIAFQPWRVFGSSGSFVMSWLEGYAMITGPISGILLADYYVVRGRVLDVEELYSSSPKGAYYYWKGWNAVAVVALLVSTAPAVPGFLRQVGLLQDVAPVFRVVYSVSWFFGFFAAAAAYLLLSSCRGPPGRAAERADGEPLLNGFEYPRIGL